MIATKREGKTAGWPVCFALPLTSQSWCRFSPFPGDALVPTLRVREPADDAKDAVRVAVNILRGYLLAEDLFFMTWGETCATIMTTVCHSIQSSASQTGSQTDLPCVVYVSAFIWKGGGCDWCTDWYICVGVGRSARKHETGHVCVCVCFCTAAFLAHIVGEHSCVNTCCLQPFFFRSVLPQLID